MFFVCCVFMSACLPACSFFVIHWNSCFVISHLKITFTDFSRARVKTFLVAAAAHSHTCECNWCCVNLLFYYYSLSNWSCSSYVHHSAYKMCFCLQEPKSEDEQQEDGVVTKTTKTYRKNEKVKRTANDPKITRNKQTRPRKGIRESYSNSCTNFIFGYFRWMHSFLLLSLHLIGFCFCSFLSLWLL